MSTGLLEKENRGPQKWILEQFSHFSTRNLKVLPQVTMQEERGGQRRHRCRKGCLRSCSKNFPGRVMKRAQEKEKMLLPASCSQKRFPTEPWAARKFTYSKHICSVFSELKERPFCTGYQTHVPRRKWKRDTRHEKEW